MYPRPDFERTSLRWESLNGAWDFLFDDEDVGLARRWFDRGLPHYVELQGLGGGSKDTSFSVSESITRRITGGTQEALKDNFVAKASAVTRNETRKIQVPFVFQSPASGVADRGVHEVLWYERSIKPLIKPDEIKDGNRILLRFGAVDYEAKVWVAGHFVGSHRGGHVPFEFDVTEAVLSADPAGDIPITLRAYDSAYDLTQPRGKQYWGAKPESIFYTPSGGIWQNVWLETVPTTRVADSSKGTVIRSDDIESGILRACLAVTGRRAGQPLKIELQASIAGVAVAASSKVDLPRERDTADISLDLRLDQGKLGQLPGSLTDTAPLEDSSCWKNGLALWSPEHPLLYDLLIRLYDGADSLIDEVRTTTGMRSLNWTSSSGAFELNGKPYFQALCLDQGYWPDTFMTPPSADALKADIEMAKAMGFNGCRKHQKVEDPIFLHLADRLGYLVWGEMANAYQFSSEYTDRFNQEWLEAVKRDINRPSIVTWTPVNESWGYSSLKDSLEQRNHIRALYYLTKTLDPTRPINDNCGWEHVHTDLTTFHDYADSPELAQACTTLEGILGPKAGGRTMFLPPLAPFDGGSGHRPTAPVLCTEFGGVNIAPASDIKANDPDERASDWGYTTASDPKDLLARIEKLVLAVVRSGIVCGVVWTQLTDIEQETNGLYSYNRDAKLDPRGVKAVMDKAQQIFREHFPA